MHPVRELRPEMSGEGHHFACRKGGDPSLMDKKSTLIKIICSVVTVVLATVLISGLI